MSAVWREAPATTGLTAVTLLVSAVILLTDMLPQAGVDAGFIPARIGMALTLAGTPLPVWITPLSATLVHGGVAHVAFNLVMLLYCGRQTERAIGPFGLLLLYVAGAYCAAAGQWLLDPGSAVPMIGASGAISAVIGAYASLYGQRRLRWRGFVSADVLNIVWLAIAWIGVQLLIGIAGMAGINVAIGAHVGGFLAGLALARPLLLWRYRSA